MNIVRTPQTPPQIQPITDGGPRPLWSVMIPTYNCTEYLEKALKSVLQQALPTDLMQIEVVDDYSTDGDVEKLVQEFGAGRVSFYRQPENRGSLRNFETCINRARGERIHILHGDDFILPGFYKEIDSLFNKNPQIGAAFTGFKYVTEHDMDLWPGKKLCAKKGVLDNIFEILAQGQVIQPPSIVVKRSVYEDLGSFYAVHYGEDWNMWMRIAAKYPMAYSPELLSRYRLHNNNITTRSLVSGKNITDTLQVIDLIQEMIPADKRSALRKKAIRSYSHYFAKISDSLHNFDPDAALLQVKEAIKMDVNVYTIYHYAKILFKRAIKYKMG